MDLSTFIKETLIGLRVGIENANKESGANGDCFEMQAGDRIDFDVAVTVLDQISGKGGAKLGVPTFVSIGSDVSVENQNAKTSRIKFSVKSHYNGFGAARD